MVVQVIELSGTSTSNGTNTGNCSDAARQAKSLKPQTLDKVDKQRYLASVLPVQYWYRTVVTVLVLWACGTVAAQQ